MREFKTPVACTLQRDYQKEYPGEVLFTPGCAIEVVAWDPKYDVGQAVFPDGKRYHISGDLLRRFKKPKPEPTPQPPPTLGRIIDL